MGRDDYHLLPLARARLVELGNQGLRLAQHRALAVYAGGGAKRRRVRLSVAARGQQNCPAAHAAQRVYQHPAFHAAGGQPLLDNAVHPVSGCLSGLDD